MDLAPKHYLLIYALIVTPIAISFFFLRRGRTPVKLNLNKDSASSAAGSTGEASPSKAVPPPKSQSHTQQPNTQKNTANAKTRTTWESRAAVAESGERALNVHFQWNGHAWDAYEVLGVPAGSSPDAVANAYKRAVSQGDSDSVLFFKAAYEAIQRSRS